VTPDPRLDNLLVRLGFLDPEVAQDELSHPSLAWWDRDRHEPSDSGAAAAIAALGRTPDADAALHGLIRIVDAADPDEARAIAAALTASGDVRSRLLNLLGASDALAEHLAQFPDHWRVLLDGEAGTAAQRIADSVAVAPLADPVWVLRASYRRELVAIAGRDFSGELDLPTVTEKLTDLADAVLAAGLAVARAARPAGEERCRLAVIAMGKTGGRELNYISDVDVIFVAETPDGGDEERALATATAIASETMRICGAAAWEVDAALRPEGKDGALVRTLASHEAYYRRWASTWEFQALLKARPCAGDLDLGRRYMSLVSPLVWTAAQRPDFVANVQAMRRRVVALLPSSVAAREIKLGPGGLRDVEFAVQLLQLVHGRADESLRDRGTLNALTALSDGGYVGRDDAVSLRDAYAFLRATEHRVQLRRLRRTHLVPDQPHELAVLARAMGYRPDRRGGAVAVFEAEWALHVREVRRLHEKLFYRPLLEAVARVPTADLRLSPEQAGERLAALGFADPDRALRHLQSLTSGVSRRALLQKALLPLMLSYFADAPDPDAGLLAYRQVSDALGSSPWYLRLLRDEGQVAERLAYVLATSRYVVDMLLRAPEALQLLGDDAGLVPRTVAELRAEMVSIVQRQDDDADAVAIARGARREELLRIAFADLLDRLEVATVGQAISATTDATLDAALQAATASIEREHGRLPVRMAVIAVGRLGGEEAGYGSDADVLFVYEPVGAPGPDDGRIAQRIAERMRTLLSAPSSDPPLGIDADLRPEGRNGPLARSLDSYARYYARWSEPWEAQALLRARVCVGDVQLATRFIELIDPVRYPAGGLSPDQLVELRRLKARVESERLPRGADPATHTKLGRGGLADVEWTVQLLQLAHGAEVRSLRTPRTLDALRAAAEAGLISAPDGRDLATAWRIATRARNAIMLVRDKAEDQLPSGGTALVGVGRALGYPAGFDPGQLADDYRRAARRARKVVEHVFYGVPRD
jgi:glutamate-ammonia-ligase adenylyltransferase